MEKVLDDCEQPSLEEEVQEVIGGGGIILQRSADSLFEGRMTESNEWRERGVAKLW